MTLQSSQAGLEDANKPERRWLLAGHAVWWCTLSGSMEHGLTMAMLSCICKPACESGPTLRTQASWAGLTMSFRPMVCCNWHSPAPRHYIMRVCEGAGPTKHLADLSASVSRRDCALPVTAPRLHHACEHVPRSILLTSLLLCAGATVLSAAALSAMPTGLPLEAPESYPQLPQWPTGAAEGVLPIVPPAVQPGTWATSAGQSDAVAVRRICFVQPGCFNLLQACSSVHSVTLLVCLCAQDQQQGAAHYATRACTLTRHLCRLSRTASWTTAARHKWHAIMQASNQSITEMANPVSDSSEARAAADATNLCNATLPKTLRLVVWVQPAAAEKLRREVARLAGEVERLDKEVQRQKALRCVIQPNHPVLSFRMAVFLADTPPVFAHAE